jgi:hypothetical protein
MAYWPRIPPKEPSHAIKNFRGSNKLDPFSLDPSFSPRTKNTISTKAPAMTTRPGFSVLGAAIGTKVLGIGIWKDTEIHAVFNDGTWRRWTGSAWSAPLKSGLSTTATWSFVNYKGNLSGINLIGSNGVDPIQKYDGTTVSNLATAPAGGNFIETHSNRLYCAQGIRTYYSPVGIADNWNLVQQSDADGGFLDKNVPEGETICGMKAGVGHVTIQFPSSTWELYGSNVGDFSYEPVGTDIGGLNDQSMTTLGGIMYFLDETGIYQYAGGVRPRKEFSAAVQWYVDNMNKAAKQTSCIGADGRFLYVALPMGSSATAPDTILVYDTIEKVWNVWEDIQAVMFAKMGESLYMADAQGHVLRLGGTTDAGAPITCLWDSKPFGARSMGQLVRWRGLWVTVDKPVGSAVQFYINDQPTGETGWKLTGSLSSEANIVSKRMPIAPTTMGNARFLRQRIAWTGPATIYESAWDQIELPIT